ncbi:methyltransferase domain-containing protein [Streptomyces hokutonensis]|uniref:methyltransferase domain-containing protein n=1 Tax=Streptomyces hokutonensis TaxID=1306990 RepID=UPI00369ED988
MDAVVIVWLPHLLPDPAPVPAEAARVLRPGGTVFPGTGQGRSPRRWRVVIETAHIPWATHAAQDQVTDMCRRLACRRLAALPTRTRPARTRCISSPP